MLGVNNRRALRAGTTSLALSFSWSYPTRGVPLLLSNISLCIHHLPWIRITPPNRIFLIRLLLLSIFLAAGHKKPEEEI